MTSNAWKWRMVLVRPRNPLNIGAAARAMANFGFHELVVVAPYAPVWQETRSAVGAEEVIQSAHAVDSLCEAIADSTLVLGATAGSRRNLDRELIPLDHLPAWLQRRRGKTGQFAKDEAYQVALLFGSEKTGLSAEHLSYCHALVRIPTEIDCPSMNLGQAVAVCCYQLARMRPRRTRLAAAGPPPLRVHLSPAATVQSIEHVFERAVRVLDHVGYLQPKSRSATIVKLRRFLFDRGLTNNEVKLLGSVLAQIEWKLKSG
jgi:TrmH family RNA methyltransferase